MTAPVMRDPDRSGEGWDDDREQVVIDSAGWDLSWGCRVTIGHDHDAVGTPDQWTATVSVSGDDQRRGIVVRAVTPDQVEAYAQHLLALVKEHRSVTRDQPRPDAGLDPHGAVSLTWNEDEHTQPGVVGVSCFCGAHSTEPDIAQARLWWHLHRDEQANPHGNWIPS